jgi:hypothetical protein
MPYHKVSSLEHVEAGRCVSFRRRVVSVPRKDDVQRIGGILLPILRLVLTFGIITTIILYTHHHTDRIHTM